MLALKHSLVAVERKSFPHGVHLSCEIALEKGTVTLPRETVSIVRANRDLACTHKRIVVVDSVSQVTMRNCNQIQSHMPL